MKSEFTALTLPRISERANCSTEPRIITLIMSAAPATVSAPGEPQRMRQPNATVARRRWRHMQIASCRLATEWITRHSQRHYNRARRWRCRSIPARRSLVENIVREDGHQRCGAAQSTTNKSSENEPSKMEKPHILKARQHHFQRSARCSIRPGRACNCSRAQEPTSVANVNTYTIPAPSSASR